MTQLEFISEVAKYVQKYAPQFGIKVCSPIIAQACLESAYGSSYKASFHNYFGLKYRTNRVKCNNGFFEDGGSEQSINGIYTALPSNTAWYSFASMEMGVKGYFEFTNISNYANLKGVSDPLTFLKNIKADGYATSLNYVQNVQKVITKWGLTKYDKVSGDDKMKIAIDAGHGSKTAGKRTPDGYLEHWINVKSAYYCEKYLKEHGIETIRVAWDDTDSTDDVDVALGVRQSQVKAAGCDYSISFHANAFGNGVTFNSANGVETLYASISSQVGDSKALAQSVQNRLIKGTTQANRGVKQQNLAMCNCTVMGTKASILVEIGFMTNEHEAELMKTDAFCREQGEDAAKGICDYLHIAYNDTPTTIVETSSTVDGTFKVKITVDELNIRKGPSTGYGIVRSITDNGVYTITEVQNGWGKLKSGAGWINISDTYVKRI